MKSNLATPNFPLFSQNVTPMNGHPFSNPGLLLGCEDIFPESIMHLFRDLFFTINLHIFLNC